MKTFSVAVIAGDGIGKEVVPEGIRVLEAAGRRFGFQFRWQQFDWSCETYVKTGKMMPPDGLQQLRPFDAIFLAVSAEYPDIRTDQYHIDILTAHFVRHPDWFDVVVGSNLFGDILSDLGPAVVGSIGIAPSANLNPEKEFPSMFEPVHGSAPDIAGKGIANPVGQIWSGAMMLRHLGASEPADAVENAIAGVLA